MDWIKRSLYGLLIGIASIAPGLSGGTIAIALGFYENLISAVANLLKDFRKNFSYLFPYGIGAVISIAALSVLFDYLFATFALPTNLLFVGFILGTLPFIKSRFNASLGGNKGSFRHILIGITAFIIVMIPVFSPDSTAIGTGSESAGGGSMLMFLVTGMIIAATLVIPGLSGTMILTSLGLYKPLLHTASSFVTSAVTLDLTAAAGLMTQIIPLVIGVFLGGFLIAKLLDMLFKIIPAYIYAAVFGLICATPFVMLSGTHSSDISIINLGAGIICLVLGLILGWKLGSSEH